jgi:sterol desaturase/sphingolipid hydroxylase (fatty acid hydroxylase superfamily)
VTIWNLKMFTPLLFYATLVTCLFSVALTTRWQPTRGILLTGSGFLSWGLLEYLLHRFVFHLEARSEFLRQLIYLLHLSHHENPQAADKLFASLWLSVPMASIYLMLAWSLFGKWQSAVYLWSGLVAGYLFYEWVHYQAHHGRPRVSLLRYLKKYHLLHHHTTPDLRFGVTSPAFDYLFGTYQSASKR